MPHPATVLVFALATLVLVATPGPGLFYVLARSVGEGTRAGLASMLGIEAAEAVYLLAAALGLSALIARSAGALAVLHLGGAAYLLVLGVRRWRAPAAAAEVAAPGAPRAARHVFVEGFAVQILNPKVAVFFIAYLPAFVERSRPAAPQILVLGVVYLAVAVLSDSVYVLLASGPGRRLLRGRAGGRAGNRVAGLTLAGLGVAGALTGSRTG